LSSMMRLCASLTFLIGALGDTPRIRAASLK
jgi:hypothetical protein